MYENDSGTGDGDDKHDGDDGSDGGSDDSNFSSGGILCMCFSYRIMLDLDRVCSNHKWTYESPKSLKFITFILHVAQTHQPSKTVWVMMSNHVKPCKTMYKHLVKTM